MKLLSIILFLGVFNTCVSNKFEHPSKAEQQVNITLNSTAQIINQKYGIQPSGEGASMPGGPIRELFLSFDTEEYCSQEKLRLLLIKCANELVTQVNANKDIKKFLLKTPFTIENVDIVIYNLDKNGREAYDPLIATSQIARGVLTYRTIIRTDTIKIKNEFKETYDEALKLVMAMKKDE